MFAPDQNSTIGDALQASLMLRYCTKSEKRVGNLDTAAAA
jgi:hypothetical protein